MSSTRDGWLAALAAATAAEATAAVVVVVVVVVVWLYVGLHAKKGVVVHTLPGTGVMPGVRVFVTCGEKFK